MNAWEKMTAWVRLKKGADKESLLRDSSRCGGHFQTTSSMMSWCRDFALNKYFTQIITIDTYNFDIFTSRANNEGIHFGIFEQNDENQYLRNFCWDTGIILKYFHCSKERDGFFKKHFKI
jgi:hypothetical protein